MINEYCPGCGTLLDAQRQCHTQDCVSHDETGPPTTIPPSDILLDPASVIAISPAKAIKKKATKKTKTKKRRKKKARKKTTAAGSERAKTHGPKLVFNADALCEIQPTVIDDHGTKLTCRFKTSGGGKDNKNEFYDPPQRWLYYLSGKNEWVPKRQLTGHDVIDFDRYLKALYSDFLIEIQPFNQPEPDQVIWSYKIPLLALSHQVSAGPYPSREVAIDEAVRSLRGYIAYPPVEDRLIQLANAETFAYHVVDVAPLQPDHDANMTPSGIPVGVSKLQPYGQ